MNKYKKLVNNSFIFAIGNMGSKLMQFIMIPLYSYTLSTSQYGKVDLLTTIIGLLMPLISLDIADAVFRYALDKDDKHEVTFNTGLYFILLVSLLTIPLSLIIQHFIKSYPIIMTNVVLIASILFSLISNYARSINKVKEFAIAGIINSFVMGILNFILLLGFHFKMNGYLVSMALGMFAACGYLIISCHLINIINIHLFNRTKFQQMLVYSVPLVPNLLAWWLNSASDRVFILFFLGASYNGIYAMANKIPNVLSTLMSIFAQSWQISVVEEYQGDEGKIFITRVFNTLVALMFVLAIAIIALIKPIFHIIVSHSYYTGWQVAPWLMLAIIYSNMSGFMGTIYTATKKTVPVMYTTIIGAIANVLLSILLIPHLHLEGAALANILSFAIVFILRLKDILHLDRITVNYFYMALLNILFIACAAINYFSGIFIPAITGITVALLIIILDPHLASVRSTINYQIKKLLFHKEQ